MKIFQFILLAMLVVGCERENHSSAPASQPAEKPRPTEVRLHSEALEENHIEIGAVEKRELVPLIYAPARVAFNPEHMAHVGAPVAGRVAELKVRLGDVVTKGQELLVVESPELGEAQSDYLQKKTAASAAEAAIEPLSIAYDRGKALYEKNQGIALAEVQKREADLRAARAAGQAATSAFRGAANKLMLMGMSEQAIAELEKTGKLTPRYAIRAPIDGQVIQCDLTMGGLVGPDKELQLDLADAKHVLVLCDVAEADYAALRKGAPATVTTAAIGEKEFAGKVTLLAAALDPATRTLQARVEIDNTDGLLRPGMLAQAKIESAAASHEKVLALPAQAVVNMEDEQFVFIPVENDRGKFKSREVKVGPAIGGFVQVLSGLKEGEKVVTRGAPVIKLQFIKPAEEE